MSEIIGELCYSAKRWLRIAWLIVRHRPFFKCPLCKGRGGESDYYGEWSECRCWAYWNDLEDWGCEWFIGRAPFREWLRFKVSARSGLPPCRVRDVIKCKLGWHRWVDMHTGNPPCGQGELCCLCYEMRERSQESPT